MNAAASAFSGSHGASLRWPQVWLALFCLALWLPGIVALPPTDRDESRYAQASKQMLESGDFVDIHFGLTPRYKKPVGIYWMQAATTTIADMGHVPHNRIWTYRLTSLIGALGLTLLTFWCARALLSETAALLAASMVGASLLTVGEASIATTDAVLAACILAAQAVALRVYLAARTGHALPSLRLILAGWAALGFAVLVKGPVALAVCGITWIGLSLWDRDGRWLKAMRPLLGGALALAIVAPWLIAIALKSHGAFFAESVGHDFAGKLAGGQESHGAPPGYFLALLGLIAWPMTLYLLPGLLGVFRRRFEPATRFLLVWIVPNWLMFELVPTKLPHYVLPLFPALALAAALAAEEAALEGDRLAKILRLAGVALFLLGAALLAAAAVLLPIYYGDGFAYVPALAAAAFTLLCLVAAVFFLRGRAVAAMAAASVAALILYPTMTGMVGPSLNRLWVSVRAAEAVAALSQPDDPAPCFAGYIEPSAMFLIGTDTSLTDARGAADIGAAQGGLALIEEKQRIAYLDRLKALGAEVQAVGKVTGYNYSRGRKADITVFRVMPMRDWAPPPPPE